MDPTSSFSLRQASTDDVRLLTQIESRVHVAPWTESHFQEELSKSFSRTLLLTDDETDEIIAGYVTFWLMDDYAEILNVAVDLPYRGLGFAQTLIQAVIRDALKDEMKRLTLEVRVSNAPAIALYQKLGFHEVGKRKKFYSNGEDALSMELTLNIAKLSGSS